MYFDSGDCGWTCEFCDALFWYEERLRSGTSGRRPRYSHCCRGGRVALPYPRVPPDSIIRLFQDTDFLTNIRTYNSMFSMTSFGAKVDDFINDGSGPYVFKVEGQIHHWIGSLCPPLNEPPRFLQMYIYDTDNELSNRIGLFSNDGRSRIRQQNVTLLMDVLATTNELVKLFRTTKDLCNSSSVPDFSIRLYSLYNALSYDKPSPGSIGAIILDEGGWSPDLLLRNNTSECDRKLTMNMYYSYLLHDRQGIYTHLLMGGRLLQQFIVDAYVCIEQSRLDYIRNNQNLFHTEFLQGIEDAVERGDSEGRSIGKRMILPSSFTGGPRYMYKHYLDALAICKVHGKPQFFITFTCNVKWPEIRHMSKFPSLKPEDRPDIIARVFHIKVKSLIDFLKKKKPFGQVTADLYTIEFQKRGLPHCHLLLWVKQTSMVTQPSDIDRFISAEIPNPDEDPLLYKVVTELMVHGPCGLLKPTSPCMFNGSCCKGFPKNFQPTTFFDKNGHVHYRRRNSGFTVKKNGIIIDSRNIVPYNRVLCLHFMAHINVEYCGWSMLIKYLFKYISKGTNRIRYKITKFPNNDTVSNESPSDVNEIQNYIDGRFICPYEAYWRIFNFMIHDRNPLVQVLFVPLENSHNIIYILKGKLRLTHK
ncbi:uncharacterized protein LOC143602926 [Bidens hawaiensis]|uniref:uncharacterized protein LOC143602926 n=1 Tax=Bidens hawaiensis TaxID=980011 RepID=UPI00404B16B4